MSDKIYLEGSAAKRNTWRKGKGPAKRQQRKRSVLAAKDGKLDVVKEIERVNIIILRLELGAANRKELGLRKLERSLRIPNNVLKEILGNGKRT